MVRWIADDGVVCLVKCGCGTKAKCVCLAGDICTELGWRVCCVCVVDMPNQYAIPSIRHTHRVIIMYTQAAQTRMRCCCIVFYEVSRAWQWH